MFIPIIESRSLDAVASEIPSAVRRTLESYDNLTSATSSYLVSRGVFAPGSGPIDYFFASLVFLSIPVTIIGHIMLYMHLNKKGREGLVGTPFQDEIERGFTFSHVASTLMSQARHLISFTAGTRGRKKSVSESDFTDSNGFTASNFTIVNKGLGAESNPHAAESTSGPILPVVAPQAPLNIALPAPAPVAASQSMHSTTSSGSGTTPRPSSPFTRPLATMPSMPSLFRSTNIKSSASSSAPVSGISVVTSTQTYMDRSGAASVESMELTELGERRK